MLVQVLKRFEGPKKSFFEPGQVLDLECRNLQGLIEYRYLAPVEALQAVQEPPTEVAPPVEAVLPLELLQTVPEALPAGSPTKRKPGRPRKSTDSIQ